MFKKSRMKTLGLWMGASLMVGSATLSPAHADCFLGEGLGYLSGYPWEVGPRVRQGGLFNDTPDLKSGITVPFFNEKKPGYHRQFSLVLERNGQLLHWYKATPQERSTFLKGDLESLVHEVTFRQAVSEILADGSERPIGYTAAIRTAYMVPVLVGQKFADKHGACPKTERKMTAPEPLRGGQRFRSAHLDETCVFTVENTDYKNRGKPDRETKVHSVLFMLDSGSGQTVFIDRELKSTRNEKGERAFTAQQASEYLDMMHIAVMASIEKLAAGESADESLHEDDRTLAHKFFKCRETRKVDGLDEDAFAKRVFGKN